ncbi:MAG: hypothetical protein QNK05_16355 [Myxococcota bacterium]|nr:hypothetical protein [Myxococcota bacterium]
MAEGEIYEEQGAPQIPPFLRDPLGILKRRWRWMLAVAIVGMVASAAAVSTLKPRYRATASLLIASQRIPEDFVRTTVPDDILQRVDGLVAQSITRERMSQLVDEHDLYPALRETATRAQVAMRARQDMQVTLDPSMTRDRRGESALVFNVSFLADAPDTAADVANEIVGLIQTEAVRLRTEQAQLTTGFLQRELDRAERELREQESRITEFKRNNRGALPDELRANLAKLERLQQQRDSLAMQIAQAATRVTMLSTAGGIDGPATPDSELATLQAALSRELSRKTDAHPDIRALRRQIADLEAVLANSGEADAPPTRPASALVQAEQQTLAELRSQLASTEAEIRELDALVGEMPALAEDFEALDQKATVLRETYLEFLRKVEQAELSESLELAQQGQRVSILNRAAPPRGPERDRLLFLALGVVVSLGAAGAMGLWLEFQDPVLIDLNQTESETGLLALGSVSRIA